TLLLFTSSMRLVTVEGIMLGMVTIMVVFVTKAKLTKAFWSLNQISSTSFRLFPMMAMVLPINAWVTSESEDAASVILTYETSGIDISVLSFSQDWNIRPE